jgi:hypothetical protein
MTFVSAFPAKTVIFGVRLRRCFTQIIAESTVIYDSLSTKKAMLSSFSDLVSARDAFSRVSIVSIADFLYDTGFITMHPLINKFDFCYNIELFTRIIRVLILIKEIVPSYDFLSKSQTVLFKDFLCSTDFIKKQKLVTNFESCYGIDSLRKIRQIVRSARELVFVYDFFRGKQIVPIRDILCCTDFESKLLIISKFDLCHSLETVARIKHYIKSVLDLALAYDILSINQIISLRDFLYDTGYVVKLPTINKYDLWYIVEIIAKIIYTLMQKTVRRVYFLPPEYAVWRDIILAADHNTKVLVCKAFLDAFKNVRDKLFAERISVGDSCTVSDSVEVIKT